MICLSVADEMRLNESDSVKIMARKVTIHMTREAGDWYVHTHNDSNLEGIRIDGEFFPDEGIYTWGSKPALFNKNDPAFRGDYFVEGVFRKATKSEIERGININDPLDKALELMEINKEIVLIYKDGTETDISHKFKLGKDEEK